MEEICDFLVEMDKAVTSVEGQNEVSGVGLGGRGHCCCCDAANADCWDGTRITYSYSCQMDYCLLFSESVPKVAISQYNLN